MRKEQEKMHIYATLVPAPRCDLTDVTFLDVSNRRYELR